MSWRMYDRDTIEVIESNLGAWSDSSSKSDATILPTVIIIIHELILAVTPIQRRPTWQDLVTRHFRSVY